jgi:hypothetical protein
MTLDTFPRPEQKVCIGCDRRPAVANGLCTLCYHEMIEASDAQRRERGAFEDVRIDAAFTAAPYCFAAPEWEQQKDTGRTLLLHPACHAQVAGFYEGAQPAARHQVEAEGLVCDACLGSLDRAPRELRTLGEVLEPVDDFARPRSVA